MGNQWGTFTFASPNQNVGGDVSPCPPYNRRPWLLRFIGPRRSGAEKCDKDTQAQPPNGTPGGTRPLQLWRSRGPSLFGPLQLPQLAVIFRCALWEAHRASPDLIVEFKGRMKEEYR